jgi:hypothetical protein
MMAINSKGGMVFVVSLAVGSQLLRSEISDSRHRHEGMNIEFEGSKTLEAVNRQ